jgi:hypothetical protein
MTVVLCMYIGQKAVCTCSCPRLQSERLSHLEEGTSGVRSHQISQSLEKREENTFKHETKAWVPLQCKPISSARAAARSLRACMLLLTTYHCSMNDTFVLIYYGYAFFYQHLICKRIWSKKEKTDTNLGVMLIAVRMRLRDEIWERQERVTIRTTTGAR